MPVREEKSDGRGESLVRIKADASYYGLTLGTDHEGNVVWSSVSKWVSGGSKDRWEMRAPDLVDPRRMGAAWRVIGQPFLVVNNRRSLGFFLKMGGNALVEQSTAQRWLQNVLQPVECGPSVMSEPPRPLTTVPPMALNRAPTKKMRMDILRRDDFRCRICGRRATDHVDVELHVHHILPYGIGGLTEPDNLITLCHSCHYGLDPHFEVRLLWMVREKTFPYEIDINQIRGYEESVRLYRRLAVPEPVGMASSENLYQILIDQASRYSLLEECDPESATNLWLHAQANMLSKYVKPNGCELALLASSGDRAVKAENRQAQEL